MKREEMIESMIESSPKTTGMDEGLRLWLGMSEEDATDAVVTHHCTEHGLSTDVNGHEVSDESWDDIEDTAIYDLYCLLGGPK